MSVNTNGGVAKSGEMRTNVTRRDSNDDNLKYRLHILFTCHFSCENNFLKFNIGFKMLMI